MKVIELIEELQKYDPQATVNRFQFNNGWCEDWVPISEVEWDHSGNIADNNGREIEVFIK